MNARRSARLLAALGGLSSVLAIALGIGHPAQAGFPASLSLLLGLADGETFNNGSPVSCSSYNVASPQVSGEPADGGCNSSNSGDNGPPVPCVICMTVQASQPVTGTPDGGPGVIASTADCGLKKVGTCSKRTLGQGPVVQYYRDVTGVVAVDSCKSAIQTKSQ
ncbi:MAG: hypothetical protein U0800_01515 [Isosphaeraceae bacterium]